VFLAGESRLLETTGEGAAQVIAAGRCSDDTLVLAIVPRFSSRLTGPDHPLPVGIKSWKTTCLQLPADWQGRSFHNIFTREHVETSGQDGEVGIRVAEALAICPVALLVADSH